jgi:hypothetical protein
MAVAVGVGWDFTTDVEIDMEPLAVGVASFEGAADRKHALNSTTAARATAMMMVTFLNMHSSSEIARNDIQNDTSTTFLKRQARNLEKTVLIFPSKL